MRRLLFLAVFSSSLVLAAEPRYKNPTTPDQIYQNDVDLLDGIRFKNYGVHTAVNARAGFTGEYLSSSSAGVLQNLTNGQFINVVSTITGSGGDFDFTLVCGNSLNGATSSGVTQAAISLFSGNTTTDQIEGDNQSTSVAPTSSAGVNITVPNWRVLVSSNTTVYGKVLANFSVGTEQARCRLSGRRSGNVK